MSAACFAGPDIAYARSQCTNMVNPGPGLIIAAERILKYRAGANNLKGTHTQTDNPSTADCLTAYADTDHAVDPESRHCITGYMSILKYEQCLGSQFDTH